MKSAIIEFYHAWIQPQPSLIQKLLLSSLKIHSKHSYSTVTLTTTHSFSLNSDDGSHLEFYLSWIWPFWKQNSDSFILIQSWLIAAIIHSHSTWWWQPSWISIILESLKSNLTTLWLWLKLIQSDSNSFILTQLDDGSHLEFCHPGFSHFAQKKIHSFILTQLDDVSHLEFCYVGFRHCHLGFRHLVIFSQIHSKTRLLYSDSDSN